MSNIDKRAYRADGGDIGTGRLREIADNPYGDEEKCWLAKLVLALLYELEAKDKAWSAQDNHINQQADRIESLEKKNGELGRALGAAEKLIAELQARENIVIIKRPVIGRAYSALNRVWTEQEVRKACELAGIKLSIAAAGKGE